MKRSASAVAVLALVLSCKPVEGTPIPSGPLNVCGTDPSLESCDLYTLQPASSTAPQCATARTTDTVRRCDVGLPTFDYTVVVDVPDSSFYAPGRTFAFTHNDQNPSATLTPNPRCPLPACFPLASLFAGAGQYTVTPAAAAILGIAVNGSQSIPLQVRFIPFGPDTTAEARDLGFPMADLYVTSRLLGLTPNSTNTMVTWTAAVVGGNYQTIFYPEPPFDAVLPPVFASPAAPLAVNDTFTDSFALGSTADVKRDPQANYSTLDNESGELRTTTISRTEGLDGWQVWIQQRATQRRISTLKTLSGTTDTEVLHTIGFGQEPVASLVDNVDLVIRPPAGSLAMPKLVSAILNGGALGFKTVEFPALPPPVTFGGFVVSVAPDGSTLVGQPANLAFTSSELLKKSADSATPTPDPTLQYATVVNTDSSGQFSTVLPPGTYDVVVSPIEGTGFARYRTSIDTTSSLMATFKPPARTTVTGQAILADGRALSEATVHAEPSGFALKSGAVSPRSTLTQTDAGGFFRFEADQGEYNLMIDPQLGTGFPRLVQDRTFSGDTQDLGQIIVPLGARFPLTIKDPSDVANPIAYAVVRVFAEYSGLAQPAVEIGTFTTDATGYAEISLTPPTR